MPVYLIRSGEAGLTKIGFSQSVHDRIVKIQADSPDTLTLLRILDGGRDVEAALHARFAHLRVRGEWFTFSNEMLDDLGYPDLSLDKMPVQRAEGASREWTTEQRLKAAASQLALHANPEKREARNTKLRATMLRKGRYRYINEVVKRAGGWHRLAAALGLPPLEIIGWQKIPLRHVEAVAVAADVPVMKLADIVERDPSEEAA